MGPAAEDAVPALVAALGRMTTTNHSARKALSEIGPAAVPALEDAIREDSDPRVRASSVATLRMMGPDAIKAAPALRQALHDEHATVRLAAAEALSGMSGQPDEALVTVLLQLMDGAEDPALWNGSTLRHGAIRCLGRIGPAAKTAAPALRLALEDDRPHIRIDAACSLWSVEQNAEEALPIFVELLESADRSVAETAAYRLGHLGQTAAPAVPALVRAFRQGQPAMRDRVLRSLRAIGPAAKEAIPALVEVVVSAEAKPTAESRDAVVVLMEIDPGTVAKIIEDHPNVAKILRPRDRHRLRELTRTEGEK
jgi:HEAT repeat protein